MSEPTKVLFQILSIFLMCNIISALDLKKDIEGRNCTVTEPITKYTFDFWEISSELGYFIDGTEDEMDQYSFNLCKSLSRPCKNQTNAAACLNKHGSHEEIIIGYEGKLYWNNGLIRMSYIGEKCKGDTNFTLNVQLHCSFMQTKNDFLGVFHLQDECEINIVMQTHAACLKIPENVKNAKLYAKDKHNKTLNLNPLKSSNHLTDSIPKSSDYFIIGFPLLYGHDVLCAAGTSVCLVNSTEKDLSKRFKNVGMMTSDIKFEKDNYNSPIMILTSNEKCDDNKKYSSKITFKCDELVSEGTAKFLKQHDCVYYFEWETRYACSQEEKCRISGPNGELYDFSSIAGLQYKVKLDNKSDEFIHFSICSAAKECGNGDWGSCIVKTANGNRQTTNVGIYSHNLKVLNKNSFLIYENGAVCNKYGDKYSTKIEFILADNQQDEEIVLIEDKCEIILHFKTLLVDQRGKNCVVKDRNDVEIDLRPLIDYNGNYEAKIDTKESDQNVHYFLNICRPLNSRYSLNCQGNSGACRTVKKGNKNEEELSLGHFEYIMTTEPDQTTASTRVIMKYLHGSKCPEDKDDELSTKITFFCDETIGLGTPILKSISDCVYNFDFPTNILCKDKHLELKSNDSCMLWNKNINKTLDLKLFDFFEHENVKINICNGSAKDYTLNYKNSMIVIEYAENNRDIEVQLKCSLENTTKIDTNSNQVLVMVESTSICPLLNIVPKMMSFVAGPKSNTHAVDSSTPKTDELLTTPNVVSSSGFSLGYIFLLVILIVAFGVFYIVLRNPERRDIILNIVKFRSRSSNVRYARVNASEESALLVDNHVALLPSDSDDENILL